MHENIPVQAELPQNILRVDGRPSRMKRNQEQYAAIESKQGMIPWNGQQDNLIDRFDGRALLDFYKEPDGHSRRQHKSEDEIELDEVNYHLIASSMAISLTMVMAQRHRLQACKPTSPLQWLR